MGAPPPPKKKELCFLLVQATVIHAVALDAQHHTDGPKNQFRVQGFGFFLSIFLHTNPLVLNLILSSLIPNL